jgi:hypothetical protein
LSFNRKLLSSVFVFNRRALSPVSRPIRLECSGLALRRRGLRGPCGGSRGGRRACPPPSSS